MFEGDILQSIKVKQSCSIRGKNCLRVMKLDIGLYNDAGQCHLIEDILIPDTETSVV
jgi:hypothetical protein